MPDSTISSRRFNQDPSDAKRAAEAGPVLITHRGEASHVLLTIEDYRRLTGNAKTRCASPHAPDRHSERDALIAACAPTHDMLVVTRNLADCRSMGVPVLDPWSSG